MRRPHDGISLRLTLAIVTADRGKELDAVIEALGRIALMGIHLS
ncbi:hypothetical protein P775_22195 [Puniceibacterium antarcticum]|uniref:Uncharacterized protein n=1 Tax=Puniceibacterium antarcticum TaxID=1206336 RepID=A0A2G8R8T3_9RHOB|nr:hypothetical protein P775_22195 [Puniceibacterium antarcticum]